MILILNRAKEEDKEGLLNDANRIKDKIKEKHKYDEEIISCTLPILSSLNDYLTKTERGRHEVKIHIICHGNSAEIGLTEPQELARLLWENGIKEQKNIKYLVVHSCQSGLENEKKINPDKPNIPIRLMAVFFLGKYREMYIKGSSGNEVTGSDGKAYILMPDSKWEAQKYKNRYKETKDLSQYTVDFEDHIRRPIYHTTGHSNPAALAEYQIEDYRRTKKERIESMIENIKQNNKKTTTSRKNKK